MRYLQQDTGTIASFAVGTFGTTVAKILEDLQCVVNQFVAFVAMDIDDHANATRIVFVLGIIQSISHICSH